MDNKLSELSKPVAWTDERGNLCTTRNKERGLESRYHQDYEKYTTPFYSQEYVSALLAELEAKDKRIAELEAKTAMTMGVGSGNGSLFVHGDYDSIKAAQAIVLENESLRAKLATPVRLPNKNDDEFWFDSVFQVAKFDRAVERAISAAGFKFVGDE